MQRLIYSPSVNVYIKTDSGIVDLSDHVTGCSVSRQIDSVSSATVTFRNPKVGSKFLFTDPPAFHPMDPIVISMTRLKGRPVQVFTGFCDTTPYFQMFPGLASIQASCTFKKIKYTYWDPGLPFVTQFMQRHGWSYDYLTGSNRMADTANAGNTKQLNDAGLGNLLMAFLHEAGNWSKGDIVIGPMPSEAIQGQVAKIFDDLEKSGKENLEKYSAFLSDFVSKVGSDANTSVPSDNKPVKTNSSKIGSDWEKTLGDYSDNKYGSSDVNSALNQDPHNGAVPNDRQIVEKVAAEQKIPFAALWGIYGKESNYGKSPSAWFNIPDKENYWPGGDRPLNWSGSSGNFEQDARAVAKGLLISYRSKQNKDPQ